RRLIATVGERMEPDVVESAATSELGNGKPVVLMAVHTTWRYQAETVQPAAALPRAIHRRAQRGVVIEGPIRDGAADACQRLVHDPPRSDGQVADLRIALLTVR